MKPPGRAIEVRYGKDLRDIAGHPAYAATSIRRRVIVLDHELRRNAHEHRRIMLHELFHFVWVRLGNPRRYAWEKLLRAEWKARARGEAGWSAEWRKRELKAGDARNRTRKWREYCCESFCDSGACIYAPTKKEVTLGAARLAVRRVWFRKQLQNIFPI